MLTFIIALIIALAPPCPSEDVTGGVCGWDATTQGNGQGADFLVIGEWVIYP